MNKEKKTITVELTEEDISYLADALYSHKRQQRDYLLNIKESLTEEDFNKLWQETNYKYMQIFDKLTMNVANSN